MEQGHDFPCPCSLYPVTARKGLGVQKVASCPCTGDAARQRFSAEFGTHFGSAGAGTVIAETAAFREQRSTRVARRHDRACPVAGG